MRYETLSVTPLIWLACAGLLFGCEDLDDFQTTDRTVFHGEVIGSDSKVDAGAGSASFIRRGFESHTEMELTFDPDLAAGTTETGLGALQAAGTLHTYQCPVDVDHCGAGDRRIGHFDRAKLETIGSLNHDALSQYDFPGAGRIRNFILGARFRSGSGAEVVSRYAMVFVSLMENRTIEVRVIAPGVIDDPPRELYPPLFGVFVLERRAR